MDVFRLTNQPRRRVYVQLSIALLFFIQLSVTNARVETRYLHKCCRMNETCAKEIKVKVYNGTKEVNVSHNYFSITSNKTFCNSKRLPLLESEPWWVQLNGSLYHPNYEHGKLSEPETFCLYLGNESDIVQAIVCVPEDIVASLKQTPHQIIQLGMLISLPFLLVTLLVYALVPELQNIHGKCLMCYVSSLLVAYVFLISVQLDKDVPPGYCVGAALIIYFSFIVSFLWLNVMCIDIWWTFSGKRGFSGSVRQSEKKRFLLYSLYAWGIALIMLLVVILFQFIPDLPSFITKPRLGTDKCWFPDDISLGLYFYGPILVVILFNLVLFAYTTFKIWSVQRDTDQSMRHDSQRHGDDADKQRFDNESPMVYLFDLLGVPKVTYKLYLKLMLVFGVNWLMEIVSWLASGPMWVWYLTDMCNALYGVFIFFIFVCKANVWKLVKKRYHSMMGRPYLAQTYAPTSSTRSTAFSHSGTVNGGVSEADSMALNNSRAA